MAHAYNINTNNWEAKAAGSTDQGHIWTDGEFKAGTTKIPSQKTSKLKVICVLPYCT